MCVLARERKMCRTCGTVIEVGHPSWSPYFGGGFYHLLCEATPNQLPLLIPPEANRCPVCDQWFRKDPSSPACSRCVRLGKADPT